jgi:hypothetical protein
VVDVIRSFVPLFKITFGGNARSNVVSDSTAGCLKVYLKKSLDFIKYNWGKFFDFYCR